MTKSYAQPCILTRVAFAAVGLYNVRMLDIEQNSYHIRDLLLVGKDGVEDLICLRQLAGKSMFIIEIPAIVHNARGISYNAFQTGLFRLMLVETGILPIREGNKFFTPTYDVGLCFRGDGSYNLRMRDTMFQKDALFMNNAEYMRMKMFAKKEDLHNIVWPKHDCTTP